MDIPSDFRVAIGRRRLICPPACGGCRAGEGWAPGDLVDHVISDFIFLFTIIDPIGTVPVFLAVTAGMPDELRRRIALRAAVVSTALLLGCVVIGQVLLSTLSIDFAAFRVAGSIILFLFALDMIFGESKPEKEVAEAAKHADDALDSAIYPLSIPSIAGPGAMMAVIVRTDNELYSIGEQALTTLIMLAVLGLVVLAMLSAARIERLIGASGASVVSRVMGLILAAVATEGMLSGIGEYFAIGG